MTKKQWFMITLVVLSLIATVGTAYALMRKETPVVENTFTPAVVQCEVHQNLTHDGTPKYVTQHDDIRVKNTGNVAAYVRIRFVSYWMAYNDKNDEWEIVPKTSVMPELHIENGWIQGSDYTYYYPTPIAPDAYTSFIINTEAVPLATDGDYVQVLEVFAEAIQSLPTDAANSSWGVTLIDGTITAAP